MKNIKEGEKRISEMHEEENRWQKKIQ